MNKLQSLPPRPWSIKRYETGRTMIVAGPVVRNMPGYIIAMLNGLGAIDRNDGKGLCYEDVDGMLDATGRHIVKAVNLHDLLVSVLQKACDVHAEYINRGFELLPQEQVAYDRMRRVLAMTETDEVVDFERVEHVLDTVVVGTQILSIEGEMSDTATAEGVKTGPEAKGYVGGMENPEDPDGYYMVFFPDSGVEVLISAYELADESKYVLADPGERV